MEESAVESSLSHIHLSTLHKFQLAEGVSCCCFAPRKVIYRLMNKYILSVKQKLQPEMHQSLFLQLIQISTTFSTSLIDEIERRPRQT